MSGGHGWAYLSRADKRAILSGIASGRAAGGPFHVELQPSDRCNLRCFFCSTKSFRRDDELALDLLRSLVDQMVELGTRSVGLAGGGEPLAHPDAPRLFQLLREAGIPVSNLTTNGTFLHGGIAEAVLDGCDELVVSLNAADGESYAGMMGSNAPTFRRVLGNLEGLLAERRRRRAITPRVLVQFLVYKGNYRSIPRMFELARAAGVDGVLFNGLSFLPPELRMTPEETGAMMGLFEEVLRQDEYRTVLSVHSFEQDLSGALSRIDGRLGARRAAKSPLRRLGELVARPDATWAKKWRHHWRMKRRLRILEELGRRDDHCLMPWYTATVRADGSVPVCCVLQTTSLGNVLDRPLREIWYGERFERARSQIRRAMAEGADWKVDPADTGIQPSCSPSAREVQPCPFRSFFYLGDRRFVERLRAGRPDLPRDTGGP